MKLIPLTQGKFAKVDDRDYARLSKFKWSATFDGHNWYARTGRCPTIRMHQFILPGSPLLDHKNLDGLDNQRHNLRPATRTQNKTNQRKYKGCVSAFKGVTWYPYRGGGWRTQITVSKIRIHLGLFRLEETAARAYDAAAKRYFGEYAALNFP